ncbi:hypothetical protein HDZ31DRAFT_42125 [Schizophyllum fasciatum]
MQSAIPSHLVSTHEDLETMPIVSYRLIDLDAGRYRRQIEHFEYHWGLKRGELDLATPLNHVQLRSDMAERMEEEGWILMPTKTAMDALLALSEHNGSVRCHDRKAYTELLPDTEYEYEFVPLYMKERDRPQLYVSDGKNAKVVRAPYSRMPRIRSRAHPLFVVFRADRAFSYHVSKPRTKARLLGDATCDVVHLWTQPPSNEFLTGPNVWRRHRHPLSDDGSVAQRCLKTAPKPVAERSSSRRARNANRAPYPQAKSHCTRISTYDHLPRPFNKISALPSVPQSGSSDYSCYSDYTCDEETTDVGDWVDAVNAELAHSPSVLASSISRDEQLAMYQGEPARDPRNALRLSVRYNNGGLVVGGRAAGDYSSFSSNDWARYLRRTCLWSSQPPKQAYADYVDLIT